jgi:hypothetical protein
MKALYLDKARPGFLLRMKTQVRGEYRFAVENLYLQAGVAQCHPIAVVRDRVEVVKVELLASTTVDLYFVESDPFNCAGKLPGFTLYRDVKLDGHLHCAAGDRHRPSPAYTLWIVHHFARFRILAAQRTAAQDQNCENKKEFTRTCCHPVTWSTAR